MKPSSHRIRPPRWQVHIPRWKELGIEQFHVAPSYLGVLEGSTESVNKEIVEELPARAGAIFCGKRAAGMIPIHYAKPTEAEMRKPFPDFLCMALAISEPVKDETFDDETLYSRVVCCWFTGDLNRSIEALLLDGIQPFAWDDYAQNWGV